MGIDQNAARVNYTYFPLRKPSGNYAVHLTPLPSGNFQQSDPPPPRNFRVPPQGGYGYFLELHNAHNCHSKVVPLCTLVIFMTDILPVMMNVHITCFGDKLMFWLPVPLSKITLISIYVVLLFFRHL